VKDRVHDSTHYLCKCGHIESKHIHVNLGGDGPERGTCTLCPCRLFRRVAS